MDTPTIYLQPSLLTSSPSGAKGCLLYKFMDFLLLLGWFAAAVPACSCSWRLPPRIPEASHRRAASVLEELLDHRGVRQRGDVAQLPLVTGDLTEQPPHDLPCRRREGRARQQSDYRRNHPRQPQVKTTHLSVEEGNPHTSLT